MRNLSEWGTVLPVHHSHYGSVTLLWASRSKTRNMCLSWVQERCVLIAFTPKWMHFWVVMFGWLSPFAYPNKLNHKVQLRLCMQDNIIDAHATTNNIFHIQILVFSTRSDWVMCLWPSKLNIKVFTDCSARLTLVTLLAGQLFYLIDWYWLTR